MERSIAHNWLGLSMFENKCSFKIDNKVVLKNKTRVKRESEGVGKPQREPKLSSLDDSNSHSKPGEPFSKQSGDYLSSKLTIIENERSLLTKLCTVLVISPTIFLSF